jgi:hypothetical protein
MSLCPVTCVTYPAEFIRKSKTIFLKGLSASDVSISDKKIVYEQAHLVLIHYEAPFSF